MAGPEGLAATQGVCDDLRPYNSRTPQGHSIELGEEGAELRHEQRPQVRFVRVIVVGHVQ